MHTREGAERQTGRIVAKIWKEQLKESHINYAKRGEEKETTHGIHCQGLKRKALEEEFSREGATKAVAVHRTGN